MKVDQTDRGFRIIRVQEYPKHEVISRLIQESSLIGDYPDAYDLPGSSYLWVGDHHHLNREQVEELIVHLKRWLKTGSLKEGTDAAG